jgi:transposase
MEKYIMAGCDLHGESMMVKVAVNRGPSEKKEYGGGARDRRKLLGYLKKRAKEEGCEEIHLAYEASGLGFLLYDEAMAEGIKCYVLAPTKIEKSVKQKKSKTDERDAEQLLGIVRGHVLAGSAIPEIWVPDEGTRDARELLRRRLGVGEEAARVKVQVKSLLKRNGMRAPKKTGEGWTAGMRKWLKDKSQKSSRLGQGSRLSLESMLRKLEMLEEEIEKLNVAVMKLSMNKRYESVCKELMMLDGVGVLVAMVFLTEMGDMGRFQNRRQVGNYLGLVPGSFESGEQDDRKGHITHHGPGRIRKVLCQAAWVLIRGQGKEKEVYDRLVEKNPKHKKIAVVALMRRLGIRMWHVGLEAQKKAA